jgi:aldehyde:ferredoxin oxidoreductase
MHGYAGKFLDIDLSTEKVKEVSFSEDILKSYMGGRGLATKILWDRLGNKWETVDPFSPENILLILTGPLTGFYPGGRVSVSGKSPQSNGIIGSTVGGEFSIDLKCAGYDGLIITGKAANPSYIMVVENEVSIKDAKHIWGKDGKQTLKILTDEGRKQVKESFPEYGELKEPSAIYIGPAGENKTRVAGVMAKWSHAAGYGGYGGVMGSKNLKAVVAKGMGPLPEVNDIERVKILIDKVCKKCYKEEFFRRWGTGSSGFEVGNKTSSEPVRNWQEEWHDKTSFAVDRFEQKVWVKRYWADYGCPTACLKIAMPKTGEFKGSITDNPDYEMQAYLGPNLGIFTPEANVHLVSLIDDLGLCGIQAGNALGFIAEMYQRGIVNQNDLDGVKPTWGNTRAFAELAKKIAWREGIGDTLAEGSYRAALKLGKMKGKDLSIYVVHGKGVSIGAHGIRSGRDYVSNISYACSVQGGDHTSAAETPTEHTHGELDSVFNDSSVICNFNTFSVSRELIWDFFDAVTGWTTAQKEWYETNGPRILQLQRAMLLLGGPDLKWKPEVDDDNPPRFYEPLPSGPYKGRKVKKEKFQEAKNEYYEAVGWDKNGLPKPEVLRKLGLQDVEAKLRESNILH